MKVVFLKSRLSFKGGLEAYTLQLAERFAHKGCDVVILTTGSLPKRQGIEIISLAQTSKWSLYHLFRFDLLCSQWLKKNPADIVFGMERNRNQTHYRAGSGVHAAFLKRRFKVESFFKKLSFLFNPLHLYLLYLEKTAFENPKLQTLFTNSQMVRDEILSYYKIEPVKVVVVFNGVAWKERENDSLNFSEQRKKIEFLFVGNGYKRKGLSFLFPVLTKVKKENFHLTVIGHEKNIDHFRKKAKEYALEDKISFLGPQENLTSYYQRADVLLLPSLYDPFANVTLEALAMGLFVVTSKDNGASEILTEQSGYIIKDLSDFNDIEQGILCGLKKFKTKESAFLIRNTIKDLEFSVQLDKIVSKTLA